VQDNIALNGACPGEMIEKALAIATALDPSTEKKILKNLKEAFPEATVMIITHRDTILEAMDRVFVLHDKRFSDGMSVQELYENEAFKTLFSYSQK
jgi:ABC-type transport system involved in cytochrome bd biosynthesis fused ATPase/permease subunit